MWTDNETELLLNILLEYEANKVQENLTPLVLSAAGREIIIKTHVNVLL